MAFPGWTEENTSELTRLALSGWSFRQIAEQLGCSRGAVSGKVTRLGLNPPGKAERPLHAKAATRTNPRPVYAEPPDQAKLRAIHSNGDGVPLLEVTGCRYPVNNAKPGEEHLFCNARKHPEKPYCADHALIAFNPESPSDRKRAISAAAYVARRCR